MASGSGENLLEESQQDIDRIKQTANPIADNVLNGAAENLANHFNQNNNSSGNGNNKDLSDNNSNNKNSSDNNTNNSKDVLNKNKPENSNSNNKDNKNSLDKNESNNSNNKKNPEFKKDSLKNSENGGAKEGLKDGTKGGAKEGLKEGTKGATKGAAKAGVAAGNAKEGLTNGAINMLGDASRIGNDRSNTGGQIADDVQKELAQAGKDAIKAGVAAGKLVATAGTDVKAWFDLLKVSMKYIIAVIGIILLFILMLLFGVAGIIASAFAKLSEAFTAMSEQLNPTEYDNFSMEDQYEILAKAFGDEVFRAYELMLEDVNTEIDTYAKNRTYNEWQYILQYNKSQARIDYKSLYSVTDDAVISGAEQGMPSNNAPVYIGGYTGPITDDTWGVNNIGSGVDSKSKTNNNYNKGLLKENATLGTAGCYATGNEVYFDANEVKESVKANVGYSAVSDMAYLVSGYNVSMLEAPIIDTGTEVSKLKAGTTIIKYKLDIAMRIFSNTLDNNEEKFGGKSWSTSTIGFFVTAGDIMKDKIAEVLGGETSYFCYDASLIKVQSNNMTRTVFEYTENIYNVQEEAFTYTLSYNYDEEVQITCAAAGCPGVKKGSTEVHHHVTTIKRTGSTQITVIPSHSDYINGCTSTAPNISGSDPKYIDAAKNKADSTWYNVTATLNSATPVGTAYPINRSEYKAVSKQYTKYTLDIPMSAFDVDRILKAIFETSPYFGDMTYYYTDQDKTKKITTEDQIINKYGKYIGKWKYAYTDISIEYNGSNGTFTQDYVKGNIFDNGIDQQPYIQQEEVYLYNCIGKNTCPVSYGKYKTCPYCGAGTQRSDEVKDGYGDRALTVLATSLIQTNQFFNIAFSEEKFDNALMIFKQDTTTVITTRDKLIMDDYTGEQIGGNIRTEHIAGVILKDEAGVEYYPITVLDRILSNKDTILNVLENSEAIQAELASRGLTYDQKYIDPNAVQTSPMAKYVSNLIIDTTTYTNISILKDNTYAIGIGSWRTGEASSLLSEIIKNNPDAYKKACENAGIEELNLAANDWNKTTNSKAIAYQKVIKELLSLGTSEQNTKFEAKVSTIVTFFIKNKITEPATLALLSSTAMYFEDVNQLSSAGGAMGRFREYVMVASINAGADNSFETAHSSLLKWLNSSDSVVGTQTIKSKLETLYNTIKTDDKNEKIPWIGSGTLTPENIKPIIDMATLMTTSPYCSNFTYSQDGRYTISRMSEELTKMYNTGSGYIVGDCSSFVAALYYTFGYSVPTASSAYAGSSLQARTDMENMIPGDIIVWRGAESGHVEIYIGNNASIGFGSEPPKIHSNYMYFAKNYPTVKYYRIVE